MKLRALEAFCAAVEEKSISAAARRMYLSQPTVSERLMELEREARVPLLKRSRRGVELTVEGVALYDQARKVLDEVKALELALHNLRNKDEMKLRFAACVTVGERLLPEWLRLFESRMPGVVPSVFMGNDLAIVSVMKAGETPIGIVASDEYCEAFESVPVLDDELVIVVGPTHPWAHRRISLRDLSEEPFISREKGSTIKAMTERTLREMGEISLDIRMELASTTAITEAIEAGRGFSILSRTDVQRKLEAGTLVEVEGFSIPWSFKLVRHPSATLTLAEQNFFEFLLETCETAGTTERYQRPEIEPAIVRE